MAWFELNMSPVQMGQMTESDALSKLEEATAKSLEQTIVYQALVDQVKLLINGELKEDVLKIIRDELNVLGFIHKD